MAAGARGVRAGRLAPHRRFPKATGWRKHSRCARKGAQAHKPLKGEVAGASRRGGAGLARGRWPCSASAGQREPRAAGRRARGPASSRQPPARSCRHSSHCVSPAPRLPGTERRKGAGPRLNPPPPGPRLAAAVVHPEPIFDGGGVPPSLPQITFATSSQPVGPKSAGKKRLGASEFSPTVSRPGPPRPGPRRYILPSPATYPSWKRSGGLAVTQRRNVASRVSRLDARLGRGCGGVGHAGGRGGLPRRSDEKRGIPAPPETTGPCCHSPGAPLYLPSERQAFHTDSRDFKDQGFDAGQGLPRQEGNLWRRGERRQTLRWDHRALGAVGS